MDEAVLTSLAGPSKTSQAVKPVHKDSLAKLVPKEVSDEAFVAQTSGADGPVARTMRSLGAYQSSSSTKRATNFCRVTVMRLHLRQPEVYMCLYLDT
jgi:hypothetical protein